MPSVADLSRPDPVVDAAASCKSPFSARSAAIVIDQEACFVVSVNG